MSAKKDAHPVRREHELFDEYVARWRTWVNDVEDEDPQVEGENLMLRESVCKAAAPSVFRRLEEEDEVFWDEIKTARPSGSLRWRMMWLTTRLGLIRISIRALLERLGLRKGRGEPPTQRKLGS